MTLTVGPQLIGYGIIGLALLILIGFYIKSFFMWLKVKDTFEMSEPWGMFFFITSIFGGTALVFFLVLWTICLCNGNWWFS